MSSDSGSMSSASSSRLDVSAELGGPRVEVSATRTGAQRDQQGSTPGVRTSISQARIEYDVSSPPRPTSEKPCVLHDLCHPSNPDYSRIVYSPRIPCTRRCIKVPVDDSAPQGSANTVPLDSAVDGNASAAPAPARPQEKYSKETVIITKGGIEVTEEYVNDQLVRRTVKSIPPSANRQ